VPHYLTSLSLVDIQSMDLIHGKQQTGFKCELIFRKEKAGNNNAAWKRGFGAYQERVMQRAVREGQ
jgi:hypothetical protein